MFTVGKVRSVHHKLIQGRGSLHKQIFTLEKLHRLKLWRPHTPDTNRDSQGRPHPPATDSGYLQLCRTRFWPGDEKKKKKTLGAELTRFGGEDAAPLGLGWESPQVRLPRRLATVKLPVLPHASIPPASERVFKRFCFRVERALWNGRSPSHPCLVLGEDRFCVERRVLSLRGRFSSLELTPPLPPIAERHQAGALYKAPTLCSQPCSNHRGSVREARRKKGLWGTVV